jgi:hypothetical protein
LAHLVPRRSPGRPLYLTNSVGIGGQARLDAAWELILVDWDSEAIQSVLEDVSDPRALKCGNDRLKWPHFRGE